MREWILSDETKRALGAARDEKEATERNANLAEPIRAIVNGIATLIPMDKYAAGVIRSIEKAFKGK